MPIGVELVPATEDQRTARDRVTYLAWGSGLDVDQYCERERVLREHPWSRSALSSWLLCDDSGLVLSSCETYRMLSVTRSEDEPLKGNCHAVASVFTEPRLRGRGHASVMMRLLIDKLKASDRHAQASILFSDVGASLYERSGFVATAAWDWLFPAVDHASAPETAALDDRAAAEFLEKIPWPQAAFFVWPTPAQVDWAIERERFYARRFGNHSPAHRGALHTDGVALWAVDFNKRELLISQLRAGSSAALAALVQAAQQTAAAESLAKVRLWESMVPKALLADLRNGTRVQRRGSLPMICPFNEEIRAEHWNWIPKAIWV